MSTQLKTPGVYVEEISKLPPSVAQVETAIPAFVGYTEKGALKPTRISSLLEYEAIFGTAKKHQIKLTDTADGLSLEKPNVSYLMYYSLQMYFANGGGPCYITSVGGYEDTPALTSFTDALLALEKEDEPTLLVFPDVYNTLGESDAYEVYKVALDQANEMGDRFVIMDTYEGNDDNDTIQAFRDVVPADKYGAVYFPHLTTVLKYAFAEDSDELDFKISHSGTGSDYASEKDELQNFVDAIGAGADAENLELYKEQTLEILAQVNETHDTLIDITDIVNAADLSALSTAVTVVKTSIAEDAKGASDAKKLEDLKGTALYAEIKQLISAIPVVLPPSATMAGVYARVDSNRGVHKAPANVGVNYVIAPTEKISDAEQEGMNVHADGGKSINAIRTFAGKGTLVWGARTLDGNSNEWRYVPVRRFFNMVEESVQKATERFVFEPNTANTWARVQGMIENFLTQQWKAGALAGATPEQAFYVSVGLNQTMSAQDILEGKMIIEIGMAAVRPAEFIVLRFSHKLQEA